MTHRLAMLLCGCLLLTGCVLFVPSVLDLRLVEVKAVVPSDAVVLYDRFGPRARPFPGHSVVGKITVVTNTDIHKIAVAASLNVWVSLRICSSDAFIYPGDGVYFHDIDINPGGDIAGGVEERYREQAATHKDGEPFTYVIYFVPSSDINQPLGPGHPDKWVPYDFTREPADLCLKIGGGNMLGGRFISNTVVIPSANVGRAFHAIGR